MAYLKGDKQEEGCLFCKGLAESDGPENLILQRGQHAFIILNRFPYTNGHIMIVPNAHKPSIEDLEQDTLIELLNLANRAIRSLRRAYGAEAFNVGINIGRAAGAGIVDHIHLHVLPRWDGDTSFMTTVAETRVLPESLEGTYARLKASLEKESLRR